MDLNIPLSSPEGIKHDDRFHFSPVYQFASVSSSSSSSSSSSHINLFTTTESYRPQLYGPSHHEVDKNYGDDLMEDDKVKGGIKLNLWKNEDEIRSRKPKKMKKREQPYSCSSDSDMSSNKSSFPIRVCADCSTTKTPLWRSGPNGPKSLCNACGIRQRKARRAMAGNERPLKMKEKEKKTKMKKVGSGHKGWKKKGRLEQVLMKVSNSLLGVQRVFPQNERDAAILLMTLSSSA